MKTSFSTSEIAPEKARVATAPTLQQIDKDVKQKLSDFKFENKAYRRAERAKDEAEMKRLVDEEEARLREVYKTSSTAANPAGGGSTRSPGAGKMPPPPPGFNPDQR